MWLHPYLEQAAPVPLPVVCSVMSPLRRGTVAFTDGPALGTRERSRPWSPGELSTIQLISPGACGTYNLPFIGPVATMSSVGRAIVCLDTHGP